MFRVLLLAAVNIVGTKRHLTLQLSTVGSGFSANFFANYRRDKSIQLLLINCIIYPYFPTRT